MKKKKDKNPDDYVNEKGDSYFASSDTPIAYTTHWFKCGGCENLHIALVDENQMAICLAVISRKMLVNMLKTIDGPPTLTDFIPMELQ